MAKAKKKIPIDPLKKRWFAIVDVTELSKPVYLTEYPSGMMMVWPTLGDAARHRKNQGGASQWKVVPVTIEVK